MIKRILITTALVTALAAPAMAFQCPGDMKQIDASLSSKNLPPDVLAQVQALRAQGEAEHKAGDHAASVKTLGEAKALIAAN